MPRRPVRVVHLVAALAVTAAACASSAPDVTPAPTTEPAAPDVTPAPTTEPAAAPDDPPDASGPTVLIALDMQDFAYPDEAAAVLERALDLHEATEVALDVYVTDTVVAAWADSRPDLLERLASSPVAAVSYHARPPRPYAGGLDWYGLDTLGPDELAATLVAYETHAVDPVTGAPTDEPGGFAGVTATLGTPPLAAAVSAGNPAVAGTLLDVYRDLGAVMTTTHGRRVALGETSHGLLLRPETVEIRLWEGVGAEPAAVLDAAVDEAVALAGDEAYIGVKIHDNDFFATASAWTTVYVEDRRRPEWNPDLRAPLLGEDERAAVWALYEGLVRHVADAAVTSSNLARLVDAGAG
ncbi:MAG: hypothetical protein D6683_10570 [Actinomyces sp.]|nr:MAG: hypothetical protein D6683_10570 [Actinomyces sp.]